ncbi:MAG: prepilin-type N-terminal cleavage/methylation domain-containing protein [Puniceicoccaceae bacterium]
MRGLQKHTDPSGKAGFTLVEVMIGMVLMAIVFTAAFGSYFLGMRIIQDAREEVRASQIIQSELERLRTKNWAQLTDMYNNNPVEFFEPQGTFVKQYAKDYTAYRIVQKHPDSKPMYWVVVVVRWTNSRNVLVYQLFTTVFTQDGLNDYYYRDI